MSHQPSAMISTPPRTLVPRTLSLFGDGGCIREREPFRRAITGTLGLKASRSRWIPVILLTNPHHDFTSLSSGAVPAVCRQRLRRADLRDRLVPTAPAGDRIIGHLARHPARHVHGRNVSGQPAV